MSTRQLLTTAFVLLTATVPLRAGVISSGQIGGHVENGSDDLTFSATGSVSGETLSNSNFAATFDAAVTTDGLQLQMVSDGQTFYSLRTGIVDTYRVLGPNAGETVSLNAILHIEGTATAEDIDAHPATQVRIHGDMGLGLTGPNWGMGITDFNPVIQAVNGRVKSTTVVLDFFDAESNFDYNVTAPLEVVVGEDFQLSTYVAIAHTGHATTNMLNTATLSFELDDGLTIESDKGFGTSPASAIPEPSTMTLLITGAFGLVGYGYRRREQKLAA